MFLHIILTTIVIVPGVVQSRLDCSGLDIVSCHLKDRCAWIDQSETCVFEGDIECSELVEADACSSYERCTWTEGDKCVDKDILNCSSLTTKLSCMTLSKFGCHWRRIENDFECLHDKAIPCEKLANKYNCRRIENCQWVHGEGCLAGKPSICPDCSDADCSELSCKEGEESVTMNGDCCPTCVNVRDCDADKCPKPLCIEGETVVLEPGDCCPKCKRSCSCPAPDCSKVLCPPSLSCSSDEEALVLPGECCEKCVKDPFLCRGEKCDKKITCSVGEVVVTPPGKCCPVCRKRKKCSSDYEQLDIPDATCAKPDCSNVWCAKPKCESFFGTNATPEGECCPKCFPLFKCDECPGLECKEGERVVQDRGSCCPRCQKACGCEKPDCSLVKCSRIRCKPNEESVPESGGCCNSCVEKPLCDTPCGPPPMCNLGEVLTKEPGSCCPVCRRIPCVVGLEPIPAHCVKQDCSEVKCNSIECGVDEVEFMPAGSCCAECALKPICLEEECNPVECERGTYEFNDPRSCCPVCREKCPLNLG